MLNNSKNETIDQTNSYLYRCSLKSVSQTQAAIARQLTVPDRSCLGYVVPQWSAYRLPAFAIAMQHKSLPLLVSMHRWAWDVMSRKAKFEQAGWPQRRVGAASAHVPAPLSVLGSITAVALF